jgi:hypothetical protein
MDNGAISREHCKIYWDANEKEFMMEVLSKNKCAVDKILRSKGEKIKLISKSTMRISNVRLYILLPEPEPVPSPVAAAPVSHRTASAPESSPASAQEQSKEGKPRGYADYVQMAFEAIGNDAKPLSAKNIIDWATDNFADVKEQKRVNLYQGVYTALKRKFERLPEEMGDRNGYLWRKKDRSSVGVSTATPDGNAADNSVVISDDDAMEEGTEE